ncbi:hypothetical protein HHK36_030947 [Tetracentron sinense]|uniref:BHLH domain-containing protein n=1 Tax=Tetracentron sinense TaxID=13715 RepID=A0A834YDS5_TETSI|nr:hypothetical protein HHK36_030947 [Tetracentron sinense]
MSDKGNNPPLLFSSTSPTTSTTGFFPGETPPEDHHRPDAITASVSTRRFTAMENDLEDYDCESEEFLDASEGLMKAVPSRTSSKRSRAAEVHNLSEKRRRSRINEKMKALQKLIPNSNKTDKASMLDEAIEYLKQLQLQLQMLSMRNGLSSHPMYLPGVLQPLQLPQMQMAFEGNGYTGIGTRAVNQKTLTQTIFDLSNHCTSAHQPIGVSTMTNVPNSETSFRLGSSIRAHLGPFQRATSSEVICREDMLPQQQLDIGHSSRNPTGGSF